jgi:hypothetical protein
MNYRQIPQAFVRLETDEQCRWWIIDHCPLCGGQHQHGAGPMSADPMRYLGYRAGHCTSGEPGTGYVLVKR